MSKDIEIIFTQDKKGSFKTGQVKRVRMGYANNFLFPQGLAIPYTAATLLKQKTLQKKAEKRLIQAKDEALNLKSILGDKELRFVSKVYDETKLYGSISAQDIEDALKQQFDLVVSKHDIKLQFPIKSTGEFSCPIHVHADVDLVLRIIVSAEEETKKNGVVERSKVPTRRSRRQLITEHSGPEEK